MNQIHSNAVVDKNAQLGENITVGPNCVIAKGVSIGSGSVLETNVVIGEDVVIGENNHIFANSIIGGKPQILGLEQDTKIGKLIIGNNNSIREQVTIHPSMHPGKYTKIGDDNLLMIGVHIGHDCTLEDKIVMSNFVQISGHCCIGTGVWFSGMVLLHQFVTVGKWCYAAGLAGINHDVPPFVIVSGHYPPKVRGVNKRGLSRAGFSEQQQENIIEAYKKLYRQGGALLENAHALADQNGLDENVRAMTNVIINSAEHRFGRYLETFRD
jgi:UDP-N-acetylglucosamine acyltransferase